MRKLLFTKDGKPIGENNGDIGTLCGDNPKAGDRGALPPRDTADPAKKKK